MSSEHLSREDDPEPRGIGPVRYFDPEQRPLDALWLFLLRFIPKPLRTRQPFGRYFHQPERLAWAKREAERMFHEQQQPEARFSADERFEVAAAIRDWIHEQPWSLCNMGSDTCPDWRLAYEIRDLALAPLEPRG